MAMAWGRSSAGEGEQSYWSYEKTRWQMMKSRLLSYYQNPTEWHRPRHSYYSAGYDGHKRVQQIQLAERQRKRS